jgi:hypothetical protein
MASVEVITEKGHVAQVRAVEHVADPAHEPNRTDSEVDLNMPNHAQERPGPHPEASRLPDQIDRLPLKVSVPTPGIRFKSASVPERMFVPGTGAALSRNRVARKEVPLRGDVYE